jgi:hypothetical protein
MSDEKITMTLTMPKAAWNAMARIVAEFAESESYGAFPGGDPREFEPDPDCSTDEERAAHQRDCEAMTAGGQALMPPAHSWEEIPEMTLKDGTKVGGGFGHVARAGYGLGTYAIKDPDLMEALVALRDAAKVRA